MYARILAAAATLIAIAPCAADDWADLAGKNARPLPSPQQERFELSGDFGERIAGRDWLTVRTRYHRLCYQASFDKATVAALYARIDNLYEFLSGRSPTKAKTPIDVFLVPEELGRPLVWREANAMRIGAQGDLDSILAGLLREETHLFNLAYLDRHQEGEWCGDFMGVYFQERARLQAGQKDVKAGLKAPLDGHPAARLRDLDGMGENAFPEAAAALFFLEDTFGPVRMNQFRRVCLERSKALNSTMLSSTVFRDVFGRDVDTLDQEWRAFYGWAEPHVTSRLSVDQRLDLPVTYGTAKASVQTIVGELAKQVGLQYNFSKSYKQTDPKCRHYVRDLVIRNKPCRRALDDVLKHVGLRYEVENYAIVLYPK
jgi:hypothetical protein